MRIIEARRRVRRGEPLTLVELAGESWDGWTLHRGLLHHPNWRRGFTGHELAALWFECQAVRELERQVRELQADATRNEVALQLAEQRAWWYRRQLTLEAQLGMMLARVVD